MVASLLLLSHKVVLVKVIFSSNTSGHESRSYKAMFKGKKCMNHEVPGSNGAGAIHSLGGNPLSHILRPLQFAR